MVTKNTLAGGHPRGWSSAAGVTCSNAVQGVTAAAGLGAVIVGVQPLFEAIKWAGIAYLAFLAIQSLRSAAAGRYLPFDEERTPSTSSAEGWRQGFISNSSARTHHSLQWWNSGRLTGIESVGDSSPTECAGRFVLRHRLSQSRNSEALQSVLRSRAATDLRLDNLH